MRTEPQCTDNKYDIAQLHYRITDRHSRAGGNPVHHKSALYHKIRDPRARIYFTTALPTSLDSRLRGNDVREVDLGVAPKPPR